MSCILIKSCLLGVLNLRFKYKTTDIDAEYVEMTIFDLKNRYEESVSIAKLFDEKFKPQVTSISKYDPYKKEIREYKFPLAYQIWQMYYYVTSKVDSEEIDISESLLTLKKLFLSNPLLDRYGYKVNKETFYNTKEGFLYYVTLLKRRLVEFEDDFSAKELGVLAGVTGQAITNRIRRDGTLKAEKEGKSYVITNDRAKDVVKESDSPVLKVATAYGETKSFTTPETE